MLTSHAHHFSRKLSPETYRADVILKPKQMHENIRNVAPGARVEILQDAMHDVYLSRPHVRERALHTTVEWLKDITCR